MTQALPSRRDEAWKYSDLRAACADTTPPMIGDGSVIERLAAGAGALQRRTIAANTACSDIVMLGASRFDAVADVLELEAGASYSRIVVQTGRNVQLSSIRVRLGAGAKFRQFILAEGGDLARIETIADVAAAGAEVELNGVYLADAGRHADLTSTLTFQAPGAVSRQLVKGVARAGGRGVFQGQIVVERAAQNTDARQHHQGMLLAPGAEIFAKPELRIFADDVQCAHGNTCGGLDAAALFYLQSRGIPEQEASALLVEAFLLEALPDWAPEPTSTMMRERISAWLRSAP